MQRPSWVLVAVGVALLAAGVAYVAVRHASGSGDTVSARADGLITTSSSMSTTTVVTVPATNEASSTTVARPSPVTTAEELMPPFESSIVSVTASELGASWHDGCPVPPDDLRAVDLSFWGFDGATRTGRVVVHAAHAEQVVAVFRDLFAARFPVERMTPIDAYDGDDQASMRANNTSGFNCRFVAGTSRWSEHAFGRAIDVNPLVNPYVRGSSVDPPEGAAYADRSRNDPGMIHDGDAAVRAFAAQGWKWGGYWSKGKDYQHFSASGR